MKHALILGGTRGIGRAIAARCLERGMAVTVAGRSAPVAQNSALLEHPHVRVVALDIADAVAVRAVVSHIVASGDSLDLLVVSAGVYFNSRTHPLDEAASLHMLRTNVSGLTAAFEAGAEQMLAQGHGRMAAISSMAGWLKDYPGASVYGATKRTVLSLCDTYRKALAPFGIQVTAIVPGYVDTERLRELSGGDASHKPFLMPEAAAVTRIMRAIDAGAPVCVFPWQMRALIGLLNLVPKLTRLPDFTAPRRKKPGAGAAKK